MQTPTTRCGLPSAVRAVADGAYAPLADAYLQLLASGGKRLRPALVLAACGLDPSEAIRLFLRQVVVHGGDAGEALHQVSREQRGHGWGDTTSVAGG